MEFYLYLKAAHIISVIAWMAGMLYLPRLFVYHSKPSNTKEMNRVFIVMEKRLLRYIMNPAMILSWVFGFLLIINPSSSVNVFGGYFVVKLIAVVLLSILHGFLSLCRKNFELNRNKYSSNFFKVVNEIPTVLLVVVVLMIIVKPF